MMTIRGWLLLSLAGFFFGDAARAGDDAWVYFGTYTGGKSQGIYRSAFDAKTGQLGAPELAAKLNSPSFLCIHPKGTHLYAVAEAGQGAVHAFSIEKSTGKLSFLNKESTLGSGACHVTVDAAGKVVVAANYGGGSSASFPILPDGSVGPAASFHQHKGSSVNPNRQKEPHAHSANIDAAGKFAVVADLGLDQLLVYAVIAKTGAMAPHSTPFFTTP
ncbi:MAG: lactonase family protein, partial [Gemmataceae bacterium]